MGTSNRLKGRNYVFFSLCISLSFCLSICESKEHSQGAENEFQCFSVTCTSIVLVNVFNFRSNLTYKSAVFTTWSEIMSKNFTENFYNTYILHISVTNTYTYLFSPDVGKSTQLLH